MKSILILIMLIPTGSFAVPINSSWQFKRTDGVVGTVSLSGDYPSCTVYPAGKDINISIKIGALNFQSTSCYEGSFTPIVRATFALQDGSLQGGEVFYGTSFTDLMMSFAKLGPDVVGPIGNSSTFPCPPEAVAFISVAGFAVGDPDEDIVRAAPYLDRGILWG